jgi:hypothetical protein
LSVEYSTSLIAAPPLAPRVKATLTDRSREVIDRLAGAAGTVLGVAQRSDDAAPDPTALTARTCTQYSVPFVKSVVPSLDNLVMVIGLPVVSLSVLERQVAPRSVEYS